MSIQKFVVMGMMAVVTVALSCIAYALPTVSGVVAQQRWPWNGLVDIDYTITGDSEWSTDLAVRVTDHDTGKVYSPTNWHKLPPVLAGRHRATWDTTADGLDVISTNMTVSLTLFNCSDLYMVIDLSGGTNTVSFPVSYLSAVPEGGWTDEYKTTKLVLRRIPAGTFIMGQNQSDESCRVWITQPFYIGVFEVTQMQWRLVRGRNNSFYKGAARPVDQVSYDYVRGSSDGSRWPSSSSVSAMSFLGKLRAKTGLNGFDLPTEAQWEYACRAGATSAYNNGGDAEADLRMLGRYSENKSDGLGGYTDAHTAVGSYVPNGWGLYDMHGNVYEWCLDWYGALGYGIDPRGLASGAARVLRGGAYNVRDCVSWSRIYGSSNECGYGFRLVCPAGL